MNLRELEEYALEESFSIKDALWKVKEKAKSLFKFKSKEEPVNDSISKPGKSTNEEADMLYEALFFKTLSYPEFDKKLKHLLQIVLYRSDKSIANANTIIDLASKIVTSKDSGECKDFLDDVSKKWDSLLKEYNKYKDFMPTYNAIKGTNVKKMCKNMSASDIKKIKDKIKKAAADMDETAKILNKELFKLDNKLALLRQKYDKTRLKLDEPSSGLYVCDTIMVSAYNKMVDEARYNYGDAVAISKMLNSKYSDLESM